LLQIGLPKFPGYVGGGAENAGRENTGLENDGKIKVGLLDLFKIFVILLDGIRRNFKVEEHTL